MTYKNTILYKLKKERRWEKVLLYWKNKKERLKVKAKGKNTY